MKIPLDTTMLVLPYEGNEKLPLVSLVDTSTAAEASWWPSLSLSSSSSSPVTTGAAIEDPKNTMGNDHRAVRFDERV